MRCVGRYILEIRDGQASGRTGIRFTARVAGLSIFNLIQPRRKRKRKKESEKNISLTLPFPLDSSIFVQRERLAVSGVLHFTKSRWCINRAFAIYRRCMTPACRVTQHRDALREPAHRTPSSYIGELFEPQSEGRDPGIRRVKVNTTSENQPRPPTTHYLLCLLLAIPILT
jgi:hypothetical protein